MHGSSWRSFRSFCGGRHLQNVSRLWLPWLDAPLSLELQTLYMAAVYLQRNWRSRLSIYLDDMTLLPDLFSSHLGLPSPEERFGKTGLYALAEAWQARSQYPFARLEALHSTIDLFFEQVRLEKANPPYAPTN